jgi:hypothetical protein
MTKSWTKPNTDDPLFQQVEGEFWGAEYAVGLIEPVSNDSQGLIGSEALAHVEKGLNERLAFLFMCSQPFSNGKIDCLFEGEVAFDDCFLQQCLNVGF